MGLSLLIWMINGLTVERSKIFLLLPRQEELYWPVYRNTQLSENTKTKQFKSQSMNICHVWGISWRGRQHKHSTLEICSQKKIAIWKSTEVCSRGGLLKSIHSFKKYLLSTFCMSGTVSEADSVKNIQNPYSHGPCNCG